MRERYSVRKTHPRRKAPLGRKLLLELLEDRTVLAPILGFNSTVAVAKGTAVIDTAVVTGAGTLVHLYDGGGVADVSRLFNDGTWTDTTLGAAVTLGASEGNLVQNSDGTWSWSENTPTGAGPVTITAADSQGSTSIQFWLNVNQVFTVKTASDNGDNSNPLADSLRQAIVSVNNDTSNSAGTPDMIAFNIGTGPVTIALSGTGLPMINKRVLVDGFTQPGSSPNTLPVMGASAGDNAKWGITLDGSSAGASEALLIAGGNSTVEGLQIQNFSAGAIHLLTNGNDRVLGNRIQNTGGDGGSPNDIFFFGGATCVYIDGVSGNTIGGTTPDEQNELAAGDAVEIAGAVTAASNNQVLGNLIGTDGTAVVPSDFGIFIIDASDNTISKNVIAGGGFSAIYIFGGGEFGNGSNPSSGNVIQGNFINTDSTGSKSLISGGYFAIGLDGVVSNTLIGGPMDSARNVISGGSFAPFSGGIGIGVTLSGGFVPNISGTVIEGNYIGVDFTGTRALAEQQGSFGIISVWPALIVGNVIGGWGTGIAGGTTIQGNWIGTDSTGTVALPNGTGIDGGGQIGSTISGQGNIIAFNNGPGVSGGGKIEGNSIYSNAGPGITVRGQGVPIEGNSIYGNGQLGIVLGGGGRIAGVNTNASNNQANHQGPNNLMNFPVLTSVQTSAAGTTINGTLSSGTANGKPYLANATITLDFYANSPAAVDLSGHGQGQYWLGSATITTDGKGNAPPFSAVFSAASILAASTAWPNVSGGVFLPPIPNGVLPAGWFVSATATDAIGNTSEFSADIPVGPTSGGPYSIDAGRSASLYAAAGPGTSAVGYFWLINGQSYGSSSSFTGYNPTLTWATLQSLGITGPGQYSVQAEWVDSSNNETALPTTTLTIETAPVTAAITTGLPSDHSGNPTVTSGTSLTLNSGVTDPNSGITGTSYAWSVVEHAEQDALRTHTTQYATRDLGESSNANFLALGAPDGPGWGPDASDRSSPYLTLGFDTPMYADGVSIWENAGIPPYFGFPGDYNGFVTRIDLLDTNGEYHTVWSGVDPTHSTAEAPLQLTWTQTTYLVEAVRVYSTLSNGGIDIDAVQLSGSYDPTANGSLPLSGSYDPAVNRGRSDQYATSVLAAATSPDYGSVNLGSETSWGAANVVGAPNVLGGNVKGDNGDDPLAWSPAYENSSPHATPPIPADQTLGVGFAIPVYADGVTIREAEGNGFVTEVEALDTNGLWHTVWTGTDPTLPGTPADFRVNWTETTYLVSAVRIHVNIDHNLNSYEDIDSVQLHGWFSSGTLVASGSGPNLTFTPSSTDSNATYLATLTATDSLGNVAMAQTTIDVAPAVPPTAHITNPSYGAGQVSVTLSLSDPSPTDQAASFTIDWGDGSGQASIQALQGSAMPTHAYTVAGTYLLTVTATDTAGMTSPIATAVVDIDITPGDAILLGGGVSPGQVNIGTAGTAGGPTGALIADSSGNLYGTSGGGAFNDGTVFELPYQSSTQTYGPITTLFSFNGADGANLGGLAFYNGNLFGTTNTGGASGQGTIFELDLGSDTLTTLVTFNGTNGAFPAALITDASGNLYGTTSNGGTTNDGTVFKLPYNNLTHMYGPLSTLVTFDGTNGASPGGAQALITDTSGNLYGTTRPGNFGYGTVFKLPYNNLSQTYGPLCTLVTFNRTNGAYPGTLITDASGNLYGTTEVGGTSDAGTVFKLPYNNLTQTYGPLTTLVTFNGTNGVDPGALITDSSGNLYGTTGGGTTFDGSVFELTQGSYTFSTLATFDGSDGSGPNGLVPEEYNGNLYLYGTAGLGGASGNGTFFQVEPANQTLTPLASFTGNSVAMYSPTDVAFVVGQSANDTYSVNFGQTLTTPIYFAATGGSLTANGADGDNSFDKLTGQSGMPNTLSWAPVYMPACVPGFMPAPAETITFTGTSTQILVGGSGNNCFIDPGSGTTIVGGPAANTFVITATSGSGVTIEGGPSTNNYITDLGNLAGPVTIVNGNPGAADTLTVIGAPGNNTITASGNQVTAGAQTIIISAPLTHLIITGGSGNNQLTVSALTVSVQNVTLAGAGASTTYTVTAGTVNIVAGTGVNGLNVNGGRVGSITAPAGNTQPLVFAHSYSVLDNGVLSVAASGVLANDVSANSQPLTAVLASGSAHGTVSLKPDGSFTYTPAANFVGTDSFMYQAKGSDGSLSTAAPVTILVTYQFSGFLAPLNSNMAMALNRTVPIKFQLTDYNGKFITSLSAVQSMVVPGGTLTALRYDSTANQFIANWQTKGLPAGTYSVTLALADGTTYTKSVTLSKNGSSAGLTTTSAGGTGTAVGALLGGDIDLYVDNTNGDLTADELARIQDAVTAADAVTEPYGVAVTEVTDPTLADVTLNMDTTSAVGGYADGVLGCTTDGGQITIIAGWNFYAGSDPTQIGVGQYDFETVVTHELGHALGLGHSSDPTSVMYAMLNTGTENRSLSTADLNVPDSDSTGACGLHVAPQSFGSIEPGVHTMANNPDKMAPTSLSQSIASALSIGDFNGNRAQGIGVIVPATLSLPGSRPNTLANAPIIISNYAITAPEASGAETADDTQQTIAPVLPSRVIPILEPESQIATPQYEIPNLDTLLASGHHQHVLSVRAAEKLSTRIADAVFAEVDSVQLPALQQSADESPCLDSGYFWATALAGLLTATTSRHQERQQKGLPAIHLGASN
jgi:uncharacterized repeat protein (TIGR03803 family)